MVSESWCEARPPNAQLYLKGPMDPGDEVGAFPGAPAVLEEELDGEEAADPGVRLVRAALQRNDVSLARSVHQLNHGD